MKLTTEWLAEYITCDWTWNELVTRLTMSGLEFEGARELGRDLDCVVVGHILSCEKHPDADRLSVCTVDIGENIVTIVCGAPNVAVGQKVAVAIPGSILPGNFKIKKTKIRGVESFGMICAEDEIGLGDSHDGILILEKNLIPGDSIASALKINDTVIDFEVTPNRPDCLSVIGIAREVHAITGNELNIPESKIDQTGTPSSADIQIDVETPLDCPRYVARVIRNVKVGPSPDWLRRRLQAIGQRSINNIVDITNFVMMELGQPLHAFDLSKLSKKKIVVRHAREREQLLTLDGDQHELNQDILVIADGEKPIALAGIMGGKDSAVNERTTDIVLESAYFVPHLIRSTRKDLSLQTEAATRYERGADWSICQRASDRAAVLIAEYAGGEIASEPIDIFPAPPETPRINLRIKRANSLLSTNFSIQEASERLVRLGCETSIEEDVINVKVPCFRPDLLREIDLIEELGRIHGYDNIKGSEQSNGSWLGGVDIHLQTQRSLREMLVDFGYDEVVTNTVVEKEWECLIEVEEKVVIINPPTESQSLLRSRLLPSLLEVGRRNLNQQERRLRLFEVGKCFSIAREPGLLPTEHTELAVLCSGPRNISPWQGDVSTIDFFDIKGIAERIIGSTNITFTPFANKGYRNGHSAQINLAKDPVGYVGQVSSNLLEAFDIKQSVFILEIQVKAMAEFWQKQAVRFSPVPKFPTAERDLSIVVKDEVAQEDVRTTIMKGKWVEHVEFLDIYVGDQLQDGYKSLSFSIALRDPDATLTDKQADSTIGSILKQLSKLFDAKLR
ncbi:MAG: phenylalanine--tRNA ligase subunit beta [Candidatus Latescibacterota bacterium]|nr:phenylalanine--tRNA ligase subunit beta [Candidatus Latescibacterota bacterium]